MICPEVMPHLKAWRTESRVMTKTDMLGNLKLKVI